MVMAASGAGLTSAQKALISGAEQLSHKDAVSGYPGLNSSGELVGTLIGRHGTRANLLAQILRLGELATTDDTHEVFIGDGTTLGGISPAISLNSAWNIIVGAYGTPNYNGDALRSAYALAKTYTPNGNAISAINPVNIFVMPGWYQPTAQAAWDTTGINVIGLGGSRNTFLIGTNSSVLFRQQNGGMVLGGITFQRASGGNNYAFELICGNLTLGGLNHHYDLNFDVGGSTSATSMLMNSGGTLYGTYRRITTTGKFMYGNTAAIVGDVTTLFDDCDCGDVSLCARTSNVSLVNVFAGTVRNCRYNGATWGVSLAATALIDRCRFNGCGILRFAAASSGARIENTYIAPASGTCIGNATDTASVIAVHNRLKTFSGQTPFGSHITNLITTPYNVQDDNL